MIKNKKQLYMIQDYFACTC